jgi:hypothetical protein
MKWFSQKTFNTVEWMIVNKLQIYVKIFNLYNFLYIKLTINN